MRWLVLISILPLTSAQTIMDHAAAATGAAMGTAAGRAVGSGLSGLTGSLDQAS